jgi:hypothetical protein
MLTVMLVARWCGVVVDAASVGLVIGVVHAGDVGAALPMVLLAASLFVLALGTIGIVAAW